MAISRAIQKGDWIHVYDTNNNQIFSEYGGTLQGYTSSSVAIKRNGWLYTFDDKHVQISTDYIGE